MKTTSTPPPIRLAPALALVLALSLLVFLGWMQYQPMGRMQGVAGLGPATPVACGGDNIPGSTGSSPCKLTLGEQR